MTVRTCPFCGLTPFGTTIERLGEGNVVAFVQCHIEWTHVTPAGDSKETSGCGARGPVIVSPTPTDATGENELRRRAQQAWQQDRTKTPGAPA